MADYYNPSQDQSKEIKGLAYNGHKIEFLTTSTEKIPGNLHVTGDVIITGQVKKLKIVTFADGTDEEIAAMLEAHYNGNINIEDYWHVGDTRMIHIDKFNSGSQDQVSQDIKIVIYGFKRDTLTTSINNKTTAAVTIGFKEGLGKEYYWGSEYIPVLDADNYSNNPLRAILNNNLLNALPSSFSSLIKEVDKGNLQFHTKVWPTEDRSDPKNANIITKDKIWLLSYTEVFGANKYDYYQNGSDYYDIVPNLSRLVMMYPYTDLEGSQYEYFKTSANRIKTENKNGEMGSNIYYWLRSPSSNQGSTIFGYNWCQISTNGEASNAYGGYFNCYLAPAFCL